MNLFMTDTLSLPYINPRSRDFTAKVPSSSVRFRAKIWHAGSQFLPARVSVTLRVDPDGCASVHGHTVSCIDVRALKRGTS